MKSTSLPSRLIQKALAGAGVRLVRTRPFRNSVDLFLHKSRERGVDTIVDIGANRGQFGSDVIASGWPGKLVSFEPLKVCHAELAKAASAHDKWIVAPPMALGEQIGEAALNVSHNLVSSSLLPVAAASVSAAPESDFVGTEMTPVNTLDTVADIIGSGKLALKIDTQGFELAVLKGGTQTLGRVEVLQLEMSLVKLYQGGAGFAELFAHCESLDFDCVAINEGFSDANANVMLQVDGVFVRRRDPVDRHTG